MSFTTVFNWRLHSVVTVFFCCALDTCCAEEPERRLTEVVTSDGVQLHTELFLPPREGPFATVLMRTPYSKMFNDFAERTATKLANSGIACVVQDCRGTGRSGRDWYPYKTESRDGIATINWIRKQAWSNDKVGLYGDSYLGYTHFTIANQ